MKINYKSPSSRLSILEHLSCSFPSDFLKDAYLIGCQHLLPSTHLMLRTCFDNGLKPERTALIGKCYSTSLSAQRLMREEGVYVCPSSTEFDSHQCYDDQFQNNISVFLKNAIKKLKIPPHAKLIVLDDGGELISLVNSSSLKFERIIGIEQTSAGYHKLASTNLKFPVINVARCSAKLLMESSMVIEVQTKRIINMLESIALKPDKVLIAGNGALGKHLSQVFRPIYDVTCYDKIDQRSEIHKDSLDISKFDLIIGATGSSIFSAEHFDKLKNNTVLASVSSSDREFNASYLRKKIKKIDNCHTDLFINGAYLLNCGFPINFQGADEDTIPLEQIQITIALLFLGIAQGLSYQNLKNGLVNLSQHNQKMALIKFYSLNPHQVLQEKCQGNNLKHAM